MKTISKDYKFLLSKKHDNDINWGTSSLKFIKSLDFIIENYGIKSMLDYGCGKGHLQRKIEENHFGIKVVSYDPCLEKFNFKSKCELVACIDVMEYVEEEFRNQVIFDLYNNCEKFLYCVISTKKTINILPDGTNAHINLKSPNEWLKLFSSLFEFENFSYNENKGRLTFFAKPGEIK